MLTVNTDETEHYVKLNMVHIFEELENVRTAKLRSGKKL